MGKRCKGKGALLLIILLGVFLPVFLLSCGGGGSSSSSVAPTVAEFFALPITGNAPLTVAFTDNSTGGPTSWSWNFGDSSALNTEQSPSHTYASSGPYDVTLTVDGPGGLDNVTKDAYITVTTVTPPPTVAQFSGDPVSGVAPLDVTFTDLSTGAPTSWSWVFGDGGTSVLQDPSHTYTAAGSYTVTLTADGPGGPDDVTRPLYIFVGPFIPPAPVAGFFADNTTGTVPLSVAFTDNSTGSIDSYSWDFGDGSALNTEQNPSHTYNAAGTYTVMHTADGPGGPNTITEVDYITATPSVFTDDFNRGDENPLGGNWTTGPGCSDLQLTSFAVSANDDANFNCAYWNANTFTNDQYSQVTFVTIDSSIGKGPAVRIQTGLDNQFMYYAIVEDATSISIKKNENKVFTVIATFTVPSLLDDDTIKLSVEGTTLELFVNDVLRGTTTDSTFSSGAPGIWIFSTGSALDDWEGGSF